MATKRNTKEEYAVHWKNQVSEVMYGPCSDAYMNKELVKRMRETITKLCGEIDECADQLESEGVFRQE